MTEAERRRTEHEERDKALNEWLPITSNRNATWWFSAFHNVTVMVGADVLGLPYAMSHLGCVLGSFSLSEPDFDSGTCGLWAHHASSASL